MITTDLYRQREMVMLYSAYSALADAAPVMAFLCGGEIDRRTIVPTRSNVFCLVDKEVFETATDPNVGKHHVYPGEFPYDDEMHVGLVSGIPNCAYIACMNVVMTGSGRYKAHMDFKWHHNLSLEEASLLFGEPRSNILRGDNSEAKKDEFLRLAGIK
jgi:hypothetical protein